LERVRSEQLSGDNNWTELTVEVLVEESDPTPRLIVPEQHGAGQSWFDNVAIERLNCER